MIVVTIDQDEERRWRWTLWQESHVKLAVSGATYATFPECLARLQVVRDVIGQCEVFDLSSGRERVVKL